MSFETNTQEITKNSNKFRYWLLLSGLLMLISLVTAGYFFLTKPGSILSPLADSPAVLGFAHLLDKPSNKIVYGFLPYWNFKFADELDFSGLTHLAMFGLSYNLDGSIKTRESTYQEPGWRNLNSDQAQSIMTRARDQGAAITLTMTAFENQIIETILTNPEARGKCIDETVTYVSTNNYDGINLDFEYVGTPTQEIRLALTDFALELNDQLKSSNPQAHFSVSVYADSADNNRLWEIDALGEIVDHIVIMTYDFHRPSSSTAGPVAPMFGAGSLWQHDIVSLLSRHFERNSSHKLLLGIPFYGYEWRTQTNSYQSQTVSGTGQTASYRRVKDILNSEPDIQVNWNNQALSPWFNYTRNELNYQIYYEDTRSLGFKYDLVNQTEMGGIAIWALGYEGQNPEIWQQIKAKF